MARESVTSQQQSAHLSPAQTAVAPHRRAGQLAWTLLGLAAALMAASLAIALTGGETWNSKLAVIPVELALAVAGALVAARTGNRLGWLFLATGLDGAVAVLAGAYAARLPSAALPEASWAGWIFTVLVALGQRLLFLIPLLFPDGRPPSPRWRPVIWVAIAGGVVVNPLRRRVQRIVDPRFNRVRYDAEQTVAVFASTLREAVDLDAVRTDLLAAVNRAVEPAHVVLWIASSSRPAVGG